MRVLTADTVTGVVTGELPVTTLTYTEQLNTPGSLTAALPTRPARLGSADVVTADLLTPWQTTVLVESDGVILWSGVYVAATVDTDLFSLNAQTLGGYWRRLRLAFDYAADDVDQAQIVYDLMRTPDPTPAGYDALPVLTGTLRDRSWVRTDLKYVGTLIEELGAVIDGFDHRHVTNYVTDHAVGSQIVLSPPEGRPTDLVFEMGSNCSFSQVSIDGSAMVNRAGATGSGQGPQMMTATALGPLGLMPRLDDVVSDPDITVQATLQGKADLRLKRGSAPIVIPTVVAYQDAEPALGSYTVGDVVSCRGSYGLLQVDGDFKITTVSVAVDSNGGAVPTLTLAPVEVF